MRRTLGFGLALVTGKTIMVAQQGGIDLLDPWTVPVLLHDHLLAMLLYGGMDLLARLWGRRRGEEQEAAANRGMWLVLTLALGWAAAAVPISQALGAPAGLAAMRQAGGVGAVVASGLTVETFVGAGIVLAAGFGGAVWLTKAGRRRTLTLAVVLMGIVGVFGGMGRDQVDLRGLERDPFAVVIQTSAEGLKAVLVR
ncbi:MAG: hypothetical protein QF464_02655 [Myxococcota bacterium]|nr:hypothetical protein [Myxococcota bacterium]